MAYMSRLNVKKISFVRSPANEKVFVLLKSKDEPTTTTNTVHNEEDISMGDQTNTQPKENPPKETESTANDIGKVGPAVVPAGMTSEAVQKAIADAIGGLKTSLAEAKAENDLLRADIAKNQETTRKRDIRDQLVREAPFAPIEIEKAVNQIFDLEKAGFEGSATDLMNSYIATSKSLENSDVFIEKGSSGDAPADPINKGLRMVQDSVQKSTDISKSSEGNAVSNVDVVRDAIAKSLGDRGYESYRKAHHLRAKRG